MEDKYATFLAALAGRAGSPTPSTPDEALLKAIVDRLASISTAASTKELPAVTAEDNGDVLTVVSGVWAKAAPSGGGSAMVEEFTWSWEGSTPVAISTDDATDILDAYKSGKNVILHFPYLSGFGLGGWFSIGGISPFVDDDGEEIPNSIGNLYYSDGYVSGYSDVYSAAVSPLGSVADVSIDGNGKLKLTLVTD